MWGERLARWVRRDIYGQQDVNPLGPEPLDANSTSVTVESTSDESVVTVTVVVTYPVVDANAGLYMLPSPDCTTCCTGGAGLLLVTVNDTAHDGGNLSSEHRPAVVIDQAAHTLTATFNLPTGMSNQSTATVGLEAEIWPQCVLYNRHNLPALPFTVTVPVNDGSGSGGGGSVEEEGSSKWVAAIAVVFVLAAGGLLAWLVVRYMRRARGAALSALSGTDGSDATGHRDMDGLLSDDER